MSRENKHWYDGKVPSALRRNEMSGKTESVAVSEPLDDLHITGRVARERDRLRQEVTDLAEEVGDLRAIVAELTGGAVFEHTAAGNWGALISDAELNDFRERAGLEPRKDVNP